MDQTFLLDVDKFIKKAKGRTELFVREFLQDMNEIVVRYTPVETGNLRGSWWANIGEADTKGGMLDKTGGTAIARMNLVASQVIIGQVYYAMNGANYAIYVENGTSRMAPRAFVRTAMILSPGIASEAAKRVSEL